MAAGKPNKRKKSKPGTIKQWGLALLLVLIVFLGARALVAESLVIETQRMEKTLLQGDYIIIDKITYGARLPITLLSIPFTNAYTKLITLPYWRLPAIKQIKANDIVAYNYPGQLDPPIDKKTIYVSRCLAIPGDTLIITKKNIWVNLSMVEVLPTFQFNYRIVFNNVKPEQAFLNEYQIFEGGKHHNLEIYDFTLTRAQARELETDPRVKNIRELYEFAGENSTQYFPNSLIYNWNKDNSGPLVIPGKGLTIILNNRSFYLYRHIIEHFEGMAIHKNGEQVFINNHPVTSYTFKQNYYFVLDDNRDNAKDSRYWGFLPESHIIGKVRRVLVSINVQTGNARWRHFFKPIT
jgi:signal peptidase I